MKNILLSTLISIQIWIQSPQSWKCSQVKIYKIQTPKFAMNSMRVIQMKLCLSLKFKLNYLKERWKNIL